MPEPAIKMRQWGNYRPINNGYFTRRKVGQAAQTGSMLIIVTFVFWQLSLPASKQLMLIAVDFGNQVHSANSSDQSIWQCHFFCLLRSHWLTWSRMKKRVFHFGEIHFAIWRNPFCNLDNQFGHAAFSSCYAFIGQHDPGWKKSLNQISKRISDACCQHDERMVIKFDISRTFSDTLSKMDMEGEGVWGMDGLCSLCRNQSNRWSWFMTDAFSTCGE